MCRVRVMTNGDYVSCKWTLYKGMKIKQLIYKGTHYEQVMGCGGVVRWWQCSRVVGWWQCSGVVPV